MQLLLTSLLFTYTQFRFVSPILQSKIIQYQKKNPKAISPFNKWKISLSK